MAAKKGFYKYRLSEIQPHKAHAHIEKEPREMGGSFHFNTHHTPDMVQLGTLSQLC